MTKAINRLLIGTVALLAVGMMAWYLLDRPDAAQEPAYSTVELQRGDIRAVVTSTGTLNPVNTVQVGSQVSGTIQELFVDFNDQVKQGQVIAQIDPAILNAKLAEAEANLKSALAARDKAAIDVLDTRREYERRLDMHKKKLMSESELEAAKYAYQSAEVEHQSQLATVAQMQAVLQRERVNLDYTTIRAPIDGVVISRDVDVGQTVAASLQAPTLFLIANDLTKMQVEADVDEAFIGEVKQGQAVRFSVFAYPRREFTGRVAQVRLQPRVEAGVVKYNCIIHVDNEDLALKPGMTATIRIEVAHHEQVLTVSSPALRFVPAWPKDELERLRKTLKTGQAVLWREDGGALTPLVVETGIIGEKQTEVSGAGLAEGLRIAAPAKRQNNERRRAFGLSLF